MPSLPNVGLGWGALGLISPIEERPPYQSNAGGLGLEGSVGKGAPRTDRCRPWPVTQYVRGSPFARITRARRDASFRCYQKVSETTQDLRSAPYPLSKSERGAGIGSLAGPGRQFLPYSRWNREGRAGLN